MVQILNMGKATKVVPELQYVLEKLVVKKPLFVYEATDLREVSNSLNEIEMYVRGVQVSQDAEIVGNIDHRLSSGRVDSEGVQPDAFFIESVHIKKERGRRNTIVTSDPNVAVKSAIKHFAPMKEADICGKAIQNTIDMLDSMSYKTRNAIQDVVEYNGVDLMEYFIQREVLSNEIPLPKSLVIHKDKMHRYDMFLAGKQISQAYSSDRLNRKGYAVWALPDNSVRVLHINYKSLRSYAENVANGIELKRYRSFDELPTEMQPKIAVLKIAERGDPILDIGVKLGTDNNEMMYILE